MLPIILVTLGLGGIGIGAKKIVEAKENFDKAERLIKEGKDKISMAWASYSSMKCKLEYEIDSLEHISKSILREEIKRFVKLSESLKGKVTIRKNKNNKVEFIIDNKKIEIPENLNVQKAEALFKGIIKGTFTGFLAKQVTITAVKSLCTASTGTAIAELTGIAADNAIFAWLGSGAIEAGGLGILGGFTVLSIITTGPAIAITGFTMKSKSEEALTDATKYYHEALTVSSVYYTETSRLRAIYKHICLVKDTLYRLKGYFSKILNLAEKDPVKYFVKTAQVAKLCIEIIHTPIIDGPGIGALHSQMVKKIEETRRFIREM